MATYKVIQDIEAEDKLVGPLTLRQFIYAGIAAVCLYICFLAITKDVQFLMVFFLPIAMGAGFFAFPWKGEQPTEIWALARLRFALKPRVRIWDQDGAKDLVTVTVPKRLADLRPTRSLTQNEVRSRLKALADTIDSRGWATRNAAYAPYGQNWIHQTVAPVPNNSGLAVSMPSDDMFDSQSSVAQNFDSMLAKSSEQKRQRVVEQMTQAQAPQPTAPAQPAAMPYPATGYQTPQPYAGAQASFQGQGAYYQPQPVQLPQLPAPIMPTNYQQPYQAPPVEQAVTTQPVAAPAPATDLWFANGPAYPANVQSSAAASPVAPATPVQDEFPAPTDPAPTSSLIESDMPLPSAEAPTEEEADLAAAARARNAMMVNVSHMKVLQPISGDGGNSPAPVVQPVVAAAPIPAAQPAPQPPQAQTPRPDPAILELANNDDLDIATIARQAKKEIQRAPDEVEIRLH